MNRLWIEDSSRDRAEWKGLVEREGIRVENNIDAAYGIYEDGVLIATGSLFHNVLKCVAVDSSRRGGNVFSQLVSELMAEVFHRGYQSVCVYTKHEAVPSFEHLGFRLIEHVDDRLYFMEKAVSGFQGFIARLAKEKKEGGKVAAIVMNANPFTKGHQYLVRHASEENDVLHVFVLSEEMSVFSAADRLTLVKAGTAHLPNVHVHGTGSYMVSSSTFPSYFLKEDDDVTEIQARLDARLFKWHIAPALGIGVRYVGDEPYSRATNIYNHEMEKEFAGMPRLVVLERIAASGDIISATKVRRMLKDGEMDAVRAYVPETTYAFFLTDAGQKTIEKLRQQA
ncbi:[citrate (pro-3S)-lyase] ligase [Parasphaerochaeta coccoides]|uniref:[Citrate [pro-3S]-lyase] ligase n=1 Tax=Parasphaerochaeta coccoides (strain ATCC BAA-1237 / DSM 17374 / SPN1) TaxID=760011 RepID=F4GLB1_PARC1|nr:[citrate (pro-3S)-lyase] ligase [Parasphaerochaeta coccoides]AEC02943.1 citrate lyase ligase [Parasphaerochaeta coccoides DSM 17374]